MEFVIIGGDAAGMSAASKAKRTRPQIGVTVLEKTMDVSYSACGMPYNIAAPERAMDDLVVRAADVFREKQGINLLTGHCVEKIDPKGKTVWGHGADGRSFLFNYDRLLIATGAAPVRPDMAGIDLPGVMTLKSLEEGRRLKDFLRSQPVKKAVILGMGYVGLEMAEALAARDIEVQMVKPRPELLPWMAPELAEVVRNELETNGVALHSGCRIKRIEKHGERLKVVCEALELAADMVLVAIGVRPNSRMAADAGIKLGPGESITVDRLLRTSQNDIYAAGDCADAYHVVTGRRAWIPLALRANRAGWAAADNVCGKETRLPGIAGTAVFKVFDLEVARTGLNLEEASSAGFDPAAVVIKAPSKAHSYTGRSADDIHLQMIGDRKNGRLLGVCMVGRQGVAHRINAPAVALHAGMTVEAFSQTDLAYAPPFGPTWDPMLTTANQLIKKL